MKSSLLIVLVAQAAHGQAGAWDISEPHGPYRDVEFTVEEGTWMSVDVSPDGKTLLFDLLGDIYAVAASGGEARPVHIGAAMQAMPTFSPDGGSMLYLSDAGGSDNVWVSRLDGSEATTISSETVDVVTTPAWGPEDYVVAAKSYAVASETGSSELRLYHRSGGSGRLLVAKPANGTNVFEPEVSPDGRWLYYTERVSDLHDSHVFIDPNQINFAIMARDLRDGTTRRVAGGFGGATTPQVSPDGRQLAFIRRVKHRTTLFVHDLDSGDQRPVFAGLDRDAQASFIPQGTYYPRFGWFPDNRHVAIWAKGRIHRVDTRTGDASPIPIRITARHRITEPPRFHPELAPQKVRASAFQQAVLAPDNRGAAAVALGRIWIHDPEGGAPRRLTDGDAMEADPAYAPDGSLIAFVEWQDEGGGALTVTSPAGKPRVVVQSRGVIREPAFSPDGSLLAYRVSPGDKCIGGYAGEPGLYVTPLRGGSARLVAPTGVQPWFDPEGQRIYFSDEQHGRLVLKSVDRAGGEPRTHLTAGSPDVSAVSLSPDLRWVAFQQNQRIYLTAYHETGATMTLDADNGAMPVTEVTPRHGNGLRWSSDSSTLMWMEGPTLHLVQVARDSRSPRLTGSREMPFDLTTNTDVPQGTVALVNATLITMRGEEVIDNGTVVVTGNRIAAVGPAEDVDVPEGAHVVDAHGMTVMPGLVDMHGHLDDCYYSNAGIAPRKQPSHHAALAFGVTTNFDPYTSDLPGFAVSEMRQAGMTVGPRLIQTGRPLHGRSGRPDGSYLPINGRDDADRALALKDALGAAVIKSYKQPMRSQRQQIVEAARARSIMADVEGESHFYFNVSMILDGYTALEHNLPVATYYDDVVQLMAGGGTAHTPTLMIVFGGQLGENYLYQTTRSWEDLRISSFVPSTTSGYSAIPTPHGAPPHVRGMITAHVADELWDIGFRSVARSMKRLDDAGVLVNAGSHGQIQGLGMHWEMWLLAEGGMSNHRVLRAATLNGARTLGIDDQIGTLEPGKLADLIVLDDNPLLNIRNSTSVRYSMINGRLYDAMSLNEIGNYDRPRGRFYWEQPDSGNSDWRSSWAQ